MKKSLLFASAAMVLGLTAMASADPFSDVPRSHWAYDAVNSLAAKGLIDGYPDSTFKGKQNDRYKLCRGKRFSFVGRQTKGIHLQAG